VLFKMRRIEKICEGLWSRPLRRGVPESGRAFSGGS
jgi:hypothetical protein